MSIFCTGNPEQLWEYNEPILSDEGEVIGDKHVTASEKEILEQYKPFWESEMKRVGKEDLISDENCIDDWIILNWASKKP